MSNNTFAEVMRSIALEAGEITNPIAEDPSLVGAEEITIVTDNTQNELEEQLEDLSEKVEKLEDRGASAEVIQDTIESLESYVAAIHANREAGVALAGPAVQYLNMGMAASLEARGIPAEIFQAELTALQTSFESNAAEDYSTEAEAAAESMLKRLWNMLKAAVQQVTTAIREFFATIGQSATAIKASGERLKKVGGQLKGGLKDDAGTIKLSGASYLGSGASVDPVKALSDLKTHYTQDVLGITKDIRGVLGDLQSVLTDPTAEKIAAWERGIVTKAPDSKTVGLPGGYSIKYVAGQGGGLQGLSRAQFYVGKPSEKTATTMAPLDKAAITALGGKIVEIGALMDAASKDGDAVIKANEALLKAAESAVAKGADGTPETKEAARKALSAAKAAINANKSVIPSFVRHLGSAAKEAYSVGMQSARKHVGAPAEGSAA